MRPNLDFVEYGEDGDGVDGCDEGAEEEGLQEAEVVLKAVESGVTDEP